MHIAWLIKRDVSADDIIAIIAIIAIIIIIIVAIIIVVIVIETREGRRSYKCKLALSSTSRLARGDAVDGPGCLPPPGGGKRGGRSSQRATPGLLGVAHLAELTGRRAAAVDRVAPEVEQRVHASVPPAARLAARRRRGAGLLEHGAGQPQEAGRANQKGL